MSLAEERTVSWQSVRHVFVHVRQGGEGRKGKGKRLRQSYRGKFLNEVMGHMHQILIFLHVLLETPTLLLL